MRAARVAFRAAGRRVLEQPDSHERHLERVRSALCMTGSEPAQGSLADLWCAGGGDGAQAARRQALGLAQSRLLPHVAQAFAEALASGGIDVARRFATRWSVVARASLARPRRRLRCGPDDSRLLAAAAADAVRGGDPAADFIEHCRVCSDVAAFMLAVRALRSHAIDPPPAWHDLAEDFARAGAAA